MIIDTTYLLPLAKIRVKTDLLRAVADGDLKIDISFSDLGISLISIFEVQAKATKLGIPPSYVQRAINAIFGSFKVIPFYKEDIIETAHDLRGLVDDYIDCIILATAITTKRNMVTEDSLIHQLKDKIEDRYGIKIYKYVDLVSNSIT